MCHLGRDDLQFRSLKPPPQPALMELSGAVPGGMALADTPQVLTLLPITEKKLVSCICTKLCGNAAPICNSGSPDDDLSNWLQTKCGFAETDLAEILGALRGAGARKTRDLRFLQDATVAELAGVPHEGHSTVRQRGQPRLGFACLLFGSCLAGGLRSGSSGCSHTVSTLRSGHFALLQVFRRFGVRCSATASSGCNGTSDACPSRCHRPRQRSDR
jgi:hypothetical protein